MTPGIKFHRGVKQLKLDKNEIDDAIEFPDDFEFKNAKQERNFFKNFIDDVTRFDEKIEHHTKEIYDAATKSISTWMLKMPKKIKNERKLNVFSPKNESIGNVRTAVVQCNFTDVSRLIKDFRSQIIQDIDKEMGLVEMIVTEKDALHEVIDKVTEMTSDSFGIIMIRQFESLRPKFLDSLISLLYSNSTCRQVISRLRLMICVSTSPAFFTQNCDIETMNLMEVKHFKFTKLDDIFSEVISTGVHKYFSPINPDPTKDDPNALKSYDCAPGVFSGSFMSYLSDRFFSCDFSISALIRAVEFAFLQKYLEDPLWRRKCGDYEEELNKYDIVLKLFLKEIMGEYDRKMFLNIHMNIQSNAKFWDDLKKSEKFVEKKQSLFAEKSRLVDFCYKIAKKTEKIDSNFSEKLISLKEKLEEASEEMMTSSEVEKSEEKAKTPSKMSFLELQKQRKKSMAAKQNSPVLTAKSAIFSHILSFFETILRPYPSDWRCVIGGTTRGKREIQGVAGIQNLNSKMDSNDEFEIEKCLLDENLEKPLSIAWRSLLCHRNFKSVPIEQWARIFLENTKLRGSEAKGAFFAAAGQLEHIGLIRGAADKKSTNVHVLYHPISFIPTI